MISLYKKELSVFFSTTIGSLIIGLFLFVNSLLLWSDISSFNILDNAYASMDAFFFISPILFLIFIPAISMRIFSEEYSSGTIEVLITKPIKLYYIVLVKFLSVLTIILLSILPTFLYVLTISFLGDQSLDIDFAGIFGSYIGLFMLSGVFASIGVFSSAITNNQITSFLLAVIVSTFFYFGFDLLSKFDFLKSVNLFVQKIGILYHYDIMSKGLLLLSDIVYFLSVIICFLKLTELRLKNKIK